MEQAAGYREVEHTADWALQVWAADLAGLLAQAAVGMNALAEVQLADARLQRTIVLEAPDAEMLLVAFLSELLFFGEDENLGFDQFEITLDGLHLRAVLGGAQYLSRKKEIKAVTYHNLAIKHRPGRVEVEIVFDV